LWSIWGIHQPSSPFLHLCLEFLVQDIPKGRPTDPCCSDWRRFFDDWWEKIILAIGEQLQKGLNSLVILGGLNHLGLEARIMCGCIALSPRVVEIEYKTWESRRLSNTYGNMGLQYP
jgi:hypothetical protein